MTPNELADKLKEITGYSVEKESQHDSIQCAAVMLRTIPSLESNLESMAQTNEAMGKKLLDQQAEIEALTSSATLNYNTGHEDGRKLAPEKTLTDEEIIDGVKDALSGWKYIRDSHEGSIYGVGWDRVQGKLEAILRKAQET